MKGFELRSFRLVGAVLAALQAGILSAGYISSPDAAHSAASRRHTGIPSLAVAGGRLWVTYYGSPTGGEDSNNYCVLTTSADGGETWTDALVADPDGEGPVRAFDPEVWASPDGRILWTWTDRVAPLAAVATNANAGGLADPKKDRLMCLDFDARRVPSAQGLVPRQLARGVMMCKPAVLSDGTWLFPSAHWYEAPSACFYASADRGASFALRGGVTLPEAVRLFDEHTVAELGNGDLVTYIRTQGGTNVYASVSHDGGFTWEEARPAGFRHTSSRIFLKRLASGNLLLVKHGPLDADVGRRDLTAYLSDDGGATWKGGLLLDGREGAAYPDGDQASDGTIYVTYDRDRTGAQEILFAAFAEADVLARGVVSPVARLRRPIVAAPVRR